MPTNDEMMQTLIMRAAVFEQLVLAMFVDLADGFEDPRGFAAAKLGDLRRHLTEVGLPASEGTRAFEQRYGAVVDEIESRLHMVMGAPRQDG
jgi:hypothetical protein